MVAFEKSSSQPTSSSNPEKHGQHDEDMVANDLGVEMAEMETGLGNSSTQDRGGEQGLYRLGSRPFHLRGMEDDLPQDWWFASTAIPLIAATSGPLANVCSIAAIITTWRAKIIEPTTEPTFMSTAVGYPDPQWCIPLNITSLVFGCIGNIALLFNFTQRVRYIIALPATILCWYCASGLLIGITVSLNHYAPPGPDDVYSQGFWHAVIAACTYMFSAMLLMVNMLGYFLGHYPQHFQLRDDQRNLILQTMMFFLWLAAGGGIFSRVSDWSFADALYFSDVTILTVGFGDFVASNDLGRGLVFPYSVFGIIILGLMVSSIHSFANELGTNKVIKRHEEKRRVITVDRTVRSSTELEHREREELEKQPKKNWHTPISRLFAPHKSTVGPDPSSTLSSRQTTNMSSERPNTGEDRKADSILQLHTPPHHHHRHHRNPIRAIGDSLKQFATIPTRNQQKRSKLILLREERDRFNAMRRIQRQTSKFKRWYSLCLSVTAFGILWCVGAIGFWQAEQRTQHMSYFQSLYFCYVSLLTIGYGDLSPKSNAGKPYFIVWSLIAVPTMTILISDMGDTIIASFKRGTFTLADWTVLPKKGLYQAVIDKIPWLHGWVQKRIERQRIKEGFPTGLDTDDPLPAPTIDELAEEMHRLTDRDRAKRLSRAIRKVANDLKSDERKRYSYEEWVEFTRLIRFTAQTNEQMEELEEVEGVVTWDWIGEDSPMLADSSEAEWVLDRLCESLNRYLHFDPRGPDQSADNQRDQEDVGPLGGADVGDEAYLAPPPPPPPRGEEEEASSASFHHGPTSWTNLPSPRPSSRDRYKLTGRDRTPSSPSIHGRSTADVRRSWDAAAMRRFTSAASGRSDYYLSVDESGSSPRGGRRRWLSEQQIEELPGPERRRYRRFNNNRTISPDHSGSRPGRFNTFSP